MPVRLPSVIRAPVAIPALLALLVLMPGCRGPTFTRGSDDPAIDEPALSTRLDKVDLDLALGQWNQGFEAGEFVSGLAQRKPRIAILRIANDSSEHIEGALDNLLGAAETRLVQSGLWNVVDNSRLMADAVIAERLRDLGDAVDDETAAALGKEFGIEYFVNGRVGDTAEKVHDTRRVQYFLFLRVTEVATKRIVYQARVDITKQAER